MDGKWETLKSKIQEQNKECLNHRGSSGTYSVCSRCYNEVLKLMDAIENGTESELKPFNGVWHTDEEIVELLKND